MGIARHFGLAEAGTTVRTEVVAGVTTFLTLAYIVFVNPAILADAGMDHGAVFVATCLAAAVGTLLMGLYANYPIALAPGMGLNAYFAYGVVAAGGHPWPVALGAVFVAGIIFLLLSLTPFRRWLIAILPPPLQRAIAAGIGLLLAFLGLQHAGIVADSPATLVTVGDLARPEPVLAALGLVLIAALDARRVPGAILLGVLALTVVSVATGLSTLEGVASWPPSLAPTLFAMDLAGVLDASMVGVVVAFLFVDLFDTAGTLVGVTQGTPLVGRDGQLARLDRALVADSGATVVGALLGTSTVTSYVESAAGIQSGGRTGLTAVVVAVLLLACLFFAPLAASIPAFATAPALVYVASLMARGLAAVRWEDPTEAVPVLGTLLGIPLTVSIASGIGFGLILHVGAKALAGRASEVGWGTVAVTAAFALKFAFL